MKLLHFVILTGVFLGITSCTSTQKYVYHGIGYQSLRMVEPENHVSNEDATISVCATVNSSGEVSITVYNHTDEVMIIDKQNSFFVRNGSSRSFYNPNINTTSTTDFSSKTEGTSVNIGAIAQAIGVTGPIGTALSGVSVSNSGTSGSSTTSTLYSIDQPKISIAPKSVAYLGSGNVRGIGPWSLKKDGATDIQVKKPSDSPAEFNICVTYSTDGETFDKFITEFFVNSVIYVPVRSSEHANDALREILIKKSDALKEKWYVLDFNSNPGGYYINCDNVFKNTK